MVDVEIGVGDALEGERRVSVSRIAALELPAQVMVALGDAVEAQPQVLAGA